MRIKQILIAVDQLGNALAGGWADETISSRSWRCRTRQPWATLRPVIDRLFFWDADHCQSSFESERKRLQMPPELRG